MYVAQLESKEAADFVWCCNLVLKVKRVGSKTFGPSSSKFLLASAPADQL